LRATDLPEVDDHGVRSTKACGKVEGAAAESLAREMGSEITRF